jgi:hypothetical protein
LAANQVVASGEFAVWSQSAASTWCIGKIVAKNATIAYSTSVTLNVPPAARPPRRALPCRLRKASS